MPNLIIEKIPEHLGGGFTCYQEDMRYAYVGDGETEIEALKDFLENCEKRKIFTPRQIARRIKKTGEKIILEK